MLSINLFLRDSPAATCGLQRRYSLSWNDFMFISVVALLVGLYPWFLHKLSLVILATPCMFPVVLMDLRRHVYRKILSSYAYQYCFETGKSQYSYFWWLVCSCQCKICLVKQLNKENSTWNKLHEQWVLMFESVLTMLLSRKWHLAMENCNTTVATTNGAFSFISGLFSSC